jgi:hypothetical protein
VESGGAGEDDGDDVDYGAEIAACYSSSDPSPLPESHPELDSSPAQDVDGLAGSFVSEDGDRLEVDWGGTGRLITWDCADREDLPQTVGGERPYYELVAEMRFSTVNGDFDETWPALIEVREWPRAADDTGAFSWEPEVDAGGSVVQAEIMGEFVLPEPTRGGVVQLLWGAVFEGGQWTLTLSSFERTGGTGPSIPVGTYVLLPE